MADRSGWDADAALRTIAVDLRKRFYRKELSIQSEQFLRGGKGARRSTGKGGGRGFLPGVETAPSKELQKTHTGEDWRATPPRGAHRPVRLLANGDSGTAADSWVRQHTVFCKVTAGSSSPAASSPACTGTR